MEPVAPVETWTLGSEHVMMVVMMMVMMMVTVMMTRTLNSVLVKNPVQMVIECEPSFYSSSDSTLTYVT